MTTCSICKGIIPFSEQHTMLRFCSNECFNVHLDVENVRFMRKYHPDVFLVTHEPFGLPTPASRSGGKLSESFLPSPLEKKEGGLFQ